MERIIFAPGLNGNELVKSLAHYGVNCFNTRICGSGELARTALMRSGITISEEFLDSAEETAFVAEAVKGNEYFGRTSYSDICNIAFALRRMRCLVASPEEGEVLKNTFSQGIFAVKNQALLDVYGNYMQNLKDRHYIDSIMLMRRAISECNKMDCDFVVLKEYPLNPLENSLLQALSGGKVSVISISDLFNAEERQISVASYKNCYGVPNEVETIITDVYQGKAIDECTVAVTDTATYGQLFFDYSLLYDIPMTFGCGIPIMNSNPAKLLDLYYVWTTQGFYGPTAIKNMMFSGSFDKAKLFDQFPDADEEFRWKTFYTVLGQLRFNNNAEDNRERINGFIEALKVDLSLADPEDSKSYAELRRKELCIPYLEVMARELSLGITEFISKYANIRVTDGSPSGTLLMQLDKASLRLICEELMTIGNVDVDQTMDEIILNVLKMNVLKQQSEPGKMHITTIDRAITTIRKNLYVAGLSATRFPGSPKEDYLLLDADLRLFGETAERYTSSGKIMRKRDSLLCLIRLAASLNSKIYISYAGLNVSELKHENASSLIYEIYREATGRNVSSKELMENIASVEYFEPGLSITRYIGKEHSDGKLINNRPVGNPGEKWVEQDLSKEYSPSALESFFGCPRSFLLKYILSIPEQEDDETFTVISPRDEGTLAHSLMEVLADDDMGLDKFLELSGEYFDRFIAENPPVLSDNVKDKRVEFLEMMETAYRMDPHREVVLKEEDIHFVHDTGVKIHGFPDRVERLDDGTCLIVDFKTGRRVKHTKDDVNTCLQVLIYAYLMEQKGFKISGCEYRYIRLGETVTCRYDQEMKDELHRALMNFKGLMLGGDFPLSGAMMGGHMDDPCKYCKYTTICRGGMANV